MTTMLPGLWLPSRFRPGGKSYVHLPVDDMRVPVAGLGAAPLISWKSTFTLRGLGDAAAGPAAPSWCEGLIRSAMVRNALTYAGAQPSTDLYYEAVMPHDRRAFQEQYGVAFGYGGASSCGMYVIAEWDRMGLVDTRINGPYEPKVSLAISNVLNVGRDHGAYIPYDVNGPQPKPGDVLYFSGAPVGGFEHVGILVSRDPDGTTWHTVDGGQPGVEERTRHMLPNGTFSADGRELTAFVDIGRLPFPCPTGDLLKSAAAVTVGAAIGFALAWKGMSELWLVHLNTGSPSSSEHEPHMATRRRTTGLRCASSCTA